MKKRDMLSGGYTGLIILLVAVLLIVVFAFSSGIFSGEKDSKIVENSDGLIDNANDTKNLLEQNNQNTNEIASENIISNNENVKIMTATLKTSKGDITIEFNGATPKTVENFIKLAKSGFYDGTKFHRVIKGFMNQGGDPLSKDDSKISQWGMGGPGYKFDDEISANNRNDAGTIAMANAGPNTNGSQFFINAVANNFLDTKHTVFGKVTSGMDIVTAINNVKTDANDRPVEPVVLEKVILN